MLLLPGNARRPSVGRGDGACSAQRGLRAGRISRDDEGNGLETWPRLNRGHRRSRECRLRGGETGWSASSLAIEKALREA